MDIKYSTRCSRFFRGIGLSAILALSIQPAFASCPATENVDNFHQSDLVGTQTQQSGNTFTYYFDSFVDRNPANGVPGLIEYCIYPTPFTAPDSVTSVALGANGQTWQNASGPNSISFQRPQGNPSNIPLDGTQNIQMGTATWSNAPQDQKILLHINDAAECNRLYGDNPGTCFVQPGKSIRAKDLSVSKTATPSYVRTYDWDVEKNVDKTRIDMPEGDTATFNYVVDVTHDNGTDSDWAVSGIIAINNPNNFDVLGVQVADATPNGNCTVFNGSDVTVPANGSTNVGYTCTFSTQPTYDQTATNTATITWPNINSPNTSASGSYDYSFGLPTTLVNSTVTVTDSLHGELGQVSYSDTSPTEFTYYETFAGVPTTCTNYNNTATLSTGDSDSKIVTVCVGSDLDVTKDATASYDLTYGWDIQKAVVGASKAIASEGYPVTFNYKVTVSHNNGTSSNWQVKGNITATNPNDWESVTTNITDSIPGGTCVVSNGTVTIPADDAASVQYSCTFTANPETGTNTATSTWDADLFHTPNGSATGTATFAFGDPSNIIDECVTITDDKYGTLGTVCVDTNTNPKVYLYSLTFNGPKEGTCIDYTNTASFTTNDQHITASDSAVVTICSYIAALTPGYWKNHLAITGTSGCNKLPSGTSCGNNGPFAITYLPLQLGNFSVNTIATAASVFVAMNCGSSKDQDAVGCLAGHLLAAKLNVANGANSCIAPTITSSDQFLVSIGYTGPNSKYTLTASQRSQAIALKSTLDAYNNGIGCN